MFFAHKVDVLEAREMGKWKDLGTFRKGWIVMERQLGESLSRTVALMRCSQIWTRVEWSGLVWWIILSYIMWMLWFVDVTYLGEHMTAERTMWKSKAGRSSLMLWAMFCWGNHVCCHPCGGYLHSPSTQVLLQTLYRLLMDPIFPRWLWPFSVRYCGPQYSKRKRLRNSVRNAELLTFQSE